MTITTILWDMDGTLLDFKAAERAAIRTLFSEFGFGPCSDEMLDEYSKINISYWEKLERGEMTKPEILVERYRTFFTKEGIDPSHAEAFNARYQVVLGDTVVFIDNSYDIVKNLKGRVKQYITSNGTVIAQTKKLKNSGFGELVDGIFLSEELGVEKPGKGFFDRVFEKIEEKDPEKVMIVGDSLTSDIKGGNNAGILTCWYNPLKKPLPEGYRIDHEIYDLHDVTKILDEDGKEEESGSKLNNTAAYIKGSPADNIRERVADAVIFDLDGTLTDTEKYYNKAWPEALRHFGYDPEPSMVLEMRSLGRPFAPARFKEWFGGDFDYDLVRNYRRKLIRELIEENGIPLKSGAVRILKWLRANGIITAIATANEYERTSRYLERIGIGEYFDRIICADMVSRGKPAPDIYIEALRRLDLPAERTIAVEDSPNGVRSAYDAGCKVVFVPDLSEADEEIRKMLYAECECLWDIRNVVLR